MDKITNKTTEELGKLILQLKELEKLPVIVENVGKITPSEFDLIEEIGKRHEITGSDLGFTLNMTKGAISQFVREMLAKDIIQQQGDKNDKRVKWLSLTAKGQLVYQEHQQLEEKFTAALQAELNVTDLTSLVKGLQIFNKQLTKRLTRTNEEKNNEN